MSNSLSSTEYEMRLFLAARETTVRCLSLASATGENSGNCDGLAVKETNKTYRLGEVKYLHLLAI